jgi:hypothetical protein
MELSDEAYLEESELNVLLSQMLATAKESSGKDLITGGLQYLEQVSHPILDIFALIVIVCHGRLSHFSL